MLQILEITELQPWEHPMACVQLYLVLKFFFILQKYNEIEMFFFFFAQVLVLASRVVRVTNTCPMMTAYTLLKLLMEEQLSRMDGCKLEIRSWEWVTVPLRFVTWVGQAVQGLGRGWRCLVPIPVGSQLALLVNIFLRPIPNKGACSHPFFMHVTSNSRGFNKIWSRQLVWIE